MRPAIQQWAGFYHQVLGWELVPLKTRDKMSLVPAWNAIDFQPQDFRPDSNIGLKSIAGLVVLDDDCAKRGLPMGDAFLPFTPAVFGRPSAPTAKALYLCPDLDKTHTWTDLDKGHLLQFRVGQQDMVPPSWHPSGEKLRWQGRLWKGMVPHVSKEALIHAGNCRATAALIALHWPTHGRRELLLAYARVLLQLDLDDDTATNVLVLACQLGQFDDEGLSKARRAIRSTREKLETRTPVLGAAHICSELPEGAALIRRLREWFGKTDEVLEAVEELNKPYFLVDVGTETVVGEEVAESDGARSWTGIRFRSFEDFRKKLVKRTVTLGKATKPLADIWLKHPHGTQYDRLVYAPEGSGIRVGPNDLNGWQGFTVTPAPGKWSLTRDELLQQVMCRGDKARFEWLLDWIAALFQQPGRHAETALILTGPQGIGKNVVADSVLSRTFDARHARVTTHTKQVLGEFNDILSGIVLLVLDEVGLTTAAEYNATKGLITGHTIDINRKGIRVEMERSMLHVLFLSNDEVPLKVAPDDRRFAFFQLSDAHQNDTKFFARIARELDEEGGRAAMLAELLERPVDWDRLRLAPDSEGKRIAKRESWTPAQWFFFLMLRNVGAERWANHFHEGKQFRRIDKAQTGLDYRTYVAGSTFRRDIKDDRIEIHRELQRLVPAGFDFNRAVSVKGVLVRDFWTLPDWPTFKDSFAAAVGVPIDELLAAEGPTVDRDRDGEM